MSVKENFKLGPPFFRNSRNILRHLLQISLDIDIGSSQEAFSVGSELKLAEGEHILRKMHSSYQSGAWKSTQNEYQFHTEKNLRMESKPADKSHLNYSGWNVLNKGGFVLLLDVLCILFSISEGSQFGNPMECQVGGTLEHDHLMRDGNVRSCWKVVLRKRKEALTCYQSLFRRLGFCMPCCKKSCSFLLSSTLIDF